MKVMIVDDEPNVIFVVRKMLEREGYDVVGANSGEECLELLKTERPDLILLDIMMPWLSGWDVLEEIRKNEKLRSIPVVMFTIKAPTPDMVRNKNLDGLVGYIVKPFTGNSLKSSVENTIKGVAGAKSAKDRLAGLGKDMAEEYENAVKAEMIHTNLLSLLRDIFDERKKDGSLDDIQSFEDVINSEGALIESYKNKRIEIEKLLKSLKKVG